MSPAEITLLTTVTGLLGGGIGYVLRYWLERRRIHIQLDVEEKMLHNTRQYVDLHAAAKEQGIELDILDSFQFLRLDEDAMSRAELVQAVHEIHNLMLNAAYHAAMRLEGVWADHPEYEDLLDDSQNDFCRVYDACQKMQTPIRPKAIKPVLDAYYNYCIDPNEETSLAVGDAHAAINWKSFHKEMREMTDGEWKRKGKPKE